MREGLAHESKGVDVREKGRGTVKGHREILQLVATATGKQLISVCDVCECVWACRSVLWLINGPILHVEKQRFNDH